ncbi:hypothetical protein [Lapillicoccus jejuensis]|uniref:Sensory transduction regulator n=1 Tax=Lapillicoccus jejuensis TaxID=402171 RepID=A0A542E2V2_9MICO|nr:hypothetical protein [Lapillicoccus jejuensis]TQJ09668.1 hypothetical protein FB458_2781 [Lapillicoccus jejuensis]
MSDPTSLPNFPPPADEHPLRGRVLDALTDLGLRPDIDADGDVSFTIGEPAQQLFIRCQDGDFPIMRVFGQWMVGDQVPDDHELRLQRCNDFSLQLNLVKVGLVATETGENLVVSGDHIVPVGVEVGPLFQVTVNIIMEVVRMWHTSFLPPEEQERLAREAGQVPPTDPAPPQDGYEPRHRPSDEI